MTNDPDETQQRNKKQRNNKRKTEQAMAGRRADYCGSTVAPRHDYFDDS